MAFPNSSLAQILSGFLSYGALHIETPHFMAWQWWSWQPALRKCYSTESRLMIITGLITLGISVAFWCVVPPEFIAGMVKVDVRQTY